MTWALMVMGCLVVAAPARAQTTLYTFNGDSAGDWFGVSVSGAGDVNGDGFADVIVGAFSYDAPEISEGAAFVFLPEPAATASLVSGLALLSWLHRRRRSPM